MQSKFNLLLQHHTQLLLGYKSSRLHNRVPHHCATNTHSKLFAFPNILFSFLYFKVNNRVLNVSLFDLFVEKQSTVFLRSYLLTIRALYDRSASHFQHQTSYEKARYLSGQRRRQARVDLNLVSVYTARRKREVQSSFQGADTYDACSCTLIRNPGFYVRLLQESISSGVLLIICTYIHTQNMYQKWQRGRTPQNLTNISWI